MSLLGLHSPHVSMSSDFSSSLGLAEMMAEYECEAAHQSSPRIHRSPRLPPSSKSPRIDERTPLTTTNRNGTHRQEDEKEQGMRLNATLLVTIIVVTIGSSFQFGYATGVMNNSAEFIMDYFHDQDKEYTLIEWGTTVSCYGLGGLIGAVLGPKVLGRCMGRRATLLVNNVFLILSSLFITMAPVWWYQAIGRVLVGIVAGVATAVVPTYFSEISPLQIRGAVGTMHQLGITVGILVSQALSTPSLHLLGSEEKWKWLFVVPVICGLLEVIALPFLPESPSYLYATQGRDAARTSLTRLQSKDVADEYLEYIAQEIHATQDNNSNASNTTIPNGQQQQQQQQQRHENGSMTVRQLFQDRSLRKQLIVGVTVQLMMQFSGIDSVFYYSTRVFYQAGVADPELATTGLGVINVIVTIFAVKYMDTAGRKTLLMYSWMGMLTAYLLLTASFILKPYVKYMDQLSVFSMTGVIIFFAFGPGCIAWFIIAEIFPLYARDTAMAVGIFINWIANWFVAFSFPILLEYTQPYTFLVFVSTTAYFLYFTVRYVPETKGLTVAQVTQEFERIPLKV